VVNCFDTGKRCVCYYVSGQANRHHKTSEKEMKDISNLSREEQIDYCKKNIQEIEFELTDNGLTGHSELFLKELGAHYNQSFEILKLKVINEIELISGSLGTLSFLTELLNQKNLRNQISNKIPIGNYFELKKEVKGISSLYTLLGDLCSFLVFGGAYGSGTELKNEELILTVKSFIDEFLPDGYKNYDYYLIFENWSEWFANVAWDATFVIVNRNRKEINLICITDSD
jgi:hypothetical protein